jgi:hypothetical protein
MNLSPPRPPGARRRRWLNAACWLSATLLSSNALAEVLPITPDQCTAMRTHGVMPVDAPVDCPRLRSVTFRYVGFDGESRTGQVVVLDAVAHRAQAIFDALYQRQFPLGKAEPMEHYAGDDDASMNDNNTSAFNARPISGGSAWSLHAYGAAIDLNPFQNPFVVLDERGGAASVHPSSAARVSVNRLDTRPDKPPRRGRAEDVIDVFANNGFIGWGGYWDFPLDYQHFEIGSRDFARRLAASPPETASRMFDAYLARYTDCMRETQDITHEAARAQCVAKVWQ